MAKYVKKQTGFREPLVAAVVVAVAGLLASFNINVTNDLAENLIDLGSIGVALYAVIKGRDSVTPVAKVSE